MRLIRLNEGITHIEDLSIDKFIDTIKNIFNFHASEKIDGANLWFGLDDNGNFFTTREQKSADKDRKFKSKDYSKVAAYNGFRSAHDALQSLFKQEKFKKHLLPGDTVEIEVVFGTQPNVVKYSDDGINFIVLLRPVNGTSKERFEDLAGALRDKETEVQSSIIDTIDGSELVTSVVPVKWKVVKNISNKVSSSLISHKSISKVLNDLEKYLSSNNSEISKVLNKSVSNFEVVSMRLVGVTNSTKDVIKQEKAKLNQEILTKFKLPIKKQLFSDLLDNGDFLSSKLNSKDKNDPEGFVLSDGSNQIKIVDRDLFTAINEFNYKIRNELSSAVMSDDMDAPLINKGGIFGNCKLRIANLFDIKDLARSARAKKLFSSYKGKTIEQTANNFVKSLKIQDFTMYKNKILAILQDTKNELNEKLEVFKRESGDYKVELKNGKVVKYSEESKKRTLLAFAELNKELNKLITSIKRSSTTEDLIITMYGKFISDVHNKINESYQTKGSKMTENLSLLKQVSILAEDGEGGDAGGETSASATETTPASSATVSSSIAPVPLRMFKGKVLKRIKRNYFPKKKLHK